MLGKGQINDQYNFSAQPKVVKPKTKYRVDNESNEDPSIRAAYNLMYDKRVVRGNTYAAIVTTSREATQQLKTTQKTMNKALNQQDRNEKIENEFITRNISTPPPLEGRIHFGCMTDEYVEILTDKPPEFEKDAQTEFYIDRPPDRLFFPKKTGEDKETQVLDGDLFDFDDEVEPILQVLMGKTLEQSRMEVLEEEELKVMKQQQKKYDNLRAAEIAEAQKLEAEERRQYEESERRKIQHKINKDQNIQSHKKIISRRLAKECLKNMKATTFNKLVDQGVFRGVFDQDLYNTYIPWSYDQIIQILKDQNQYSAILEEMNDYLVKFWTEYHEKAMQNEILRKEMKKEEDIRKQKEKEEAKKLRAEKRKKEEHEKKIQEMKKRVERHFIRKADLKTGGLNTILSDIDAFGKENSNVALLGGLMGEILTIISTIEQMKEEEVYPNFKNVNFTVDQICKAITNILNDVTKEGMVEIGFSEMIEEAIAAIDPNCKLDNLSTASASTKAKLEEILKQNFKSVYIDSIKHLYSKEVIDLVLAAFTKIILADDQAIQKKLKLVKANINNAQGSKLLGFVKLIPQLTELTPSAWFESRSSIKGSKGGRGTQKGNKFGKDRSITSDDQSSAKDESRTGPVDIYEGEFEDKTNFIPLVHEEIRIFANQFVPTMLIRREIIMSLISIYREMETKEVEILKRVFIKSNDLEKAFVETISNFYIFEFEMF